MTQRELQTIIMRMLAEREGSICPSEVAREAASDWRPLMPLVREAARALAKAGKVIATQKDVVVDAVDAHGPIRIRKP